MKHLVNVGRIECVGIEVHQFWRDWGNLGEIADCMEMEKLFVHCRKSFIEDDIREKESYKNVERVIREVM